MASTSQSPLLVMEGIQKSFPGVHALKNVRFDLYPGEVHALMGENGAGKSTLIRILAGAQRPDSGTIRIDNQPGRIHTPRDAEKLGISVIYQEFNLVPTLSARENLFLGREQTRASFFSARAEHRQALDLFNRLNVSIDPESRISTLTVAQQQAVEIAKAISLEARILVMDEPTASLSSQEAEKLFVLIGELKRRGIGIIYVSHRMEEIFRLADRVTVLRDGQCIATSPTRELDRQTLIEMMVGRKLENEFPKERAPIGEERLIVKDLRRGSAVKGVSFSIRRGEVLGLTGLVGAGRTEVARLIFAADRHDSGAMLLDNRPYNPRSPRHAIKAGVCLISEDRKAQGLILPHSARENFGLPNLNRLSTFSFVRQNRERSAFGKYIDSLRIKIPHQEEPARNLSGGNQQKLVLAKWLEANSEVILFDEPTRGIDVGAKHEIYLLINRLAKSGKAILMISSELPEVLGMSDRILVMHEGRITGEINDPTKATQQQLLALAMRGKIMHRSISQLLTNYGMAIVLLLLCIYYSYATIRPRQLSGEAAADDVMKQIAATKTNPIKVVVAGVSPEDQLFAKWIGWKIPVQRVAHDPPTARAAIQELIAAGRAPDLVIVTEDTAKWVPKVLERIPAAKNARIISPATYNWPDFLQKENLLNIANQIVVIAIIAVGMTMVIITGGIDLSVGSLIAFSSVIVGLLIRGLAGGMAATPAALIACSLAAILATGAVGAFSGAMITFFRIPPFIATLAMMQVASGLAFKFAAGQSIYDIPYSFTALSQKGILVLVIAYLVAHIIMLHTRLGRYIYAVGGNPEAARLSGVRVSAILMTVYIISGMTAGLGGVLMTSQLKSSAPIYGQSYELFVISAVVVGGTSLSGGEGRIFGTLIGALIIAVIQNGMNLTGVDPYSQKVVSGLVILGAVLLDMLKKRSWKLPRFLRRVDSTGTTKESHAPIS